MRVKHNKDVIVVVCPHCESTLEVTKHDIEYNYHFGHASYYYIDCGACDRRFQFKSSDAPPHWNDYLRFVMQDAMGEDYD